MSALPHPDEIKWTLPSHHLASLVARAVVRSFPPNVVVLNQGDYSDYLYVILAGRVKIYLADENGKEVVLRTQGAGEYFGEMVLDEGPRSASVMSLEACRFALVSGDDFRAFLAEYPEVAMDLIRNLIGRVRALTEAVGNLALLDVYGRVARLLLELAAEEDGALVINACPTQQEMAGRVGASREMVNRILKDLRAGGYVQITGHRVIINKRLPAAW